MDDGMPDANVIQKFKLQKRTKFTKDGNGSSVESDENCGNNESETENETNNFKLKSNPAWADAMTKILRSKKTAHKKGIVLSKAKKLSDVKEKKKVELDFEIVGATNQEQSDPDEKEDKKPDTKKKFGVLKFLKILSFSNSVQVLIISKNIFIKFHRNFENFKTFSLTFSPNILRNIPFVC